jgi:hypothetical protein
VNDKPGIDHLRIGDKVVIVEKLYRSEDRLIPARITKTNRVWWEFEEIEQARSLKRTWRMRKATQCECDCRGQYYGDRFVTAEQLQWEDRCNAADKYLREIKIDGGQCGVVDKLTLANLIRTHLGLEKI